MDGVMEITDSSDESQEAMSQNDTKSAKPKACDSQKLMEEDDDDGTICPICLESWTNTGEHRISALKCGHLFGYKCVMRWLDSQSNKSCPTCKHKVRRSDLRYIYAKKLVAIDNVELEVVKSQLNEALTEKNRLFQELRRSASEAQLLKQEITQLKKKVQDLNSIGNKPNNDFRAPIQNATRRIRLYMEKNLEVCSRNLCRECRAFDVCVPKDVLVVSTRSPDIFSGFGLRQITLSSYKSTRFMALHKEPIRDVSFHSNNKWVLTASMDKKFKVVDITSGTAPYSNTLETSLWSCTWDAHSENHMYVGTQTGSVSLYDIRYLDSPVTTLSIEGDYSPVVSLGTVKSGLQSDIPQGAVLCCKLNSTWAFEYQCDGTFKRHLLPLEGPFLGLKYDDKTKQLLVSSRPNSQVTYARHTLCSLEKVAEPDSIKCNTVHNFRCGNSVKFLSKVSCFLPNDLVAGYNESRKNVVLYSVNTGEEVSSLTVHTSVLDLKGFETPTGNFLTVLTEKNLEFFKFTSF